VDLGGEIRFRQGDAKNPDRVFVDIYPALLASALKGKQWSSQSSLLQKIRVGQYDSTTVRIVLETGDASRVSSFTLRDPDRLIVEIFANETARPATLISAGPTSPALPEPAKSSKAASTNASMPTTASVAPTASVAASPETVTEDRLKTSSIGNPSPLPGPPALPAPQPTPPATAATVTSKRPADKELKPITAARPANAGKNSLVRSLGLKLARVVIDAGHGGHDTGSVGPSGYSEKELVLDVAHRLKQLIEAELGAEVVMTRTDDSFVPLEERTALANRERADLFVSIHANSSPASSARGVETFVLNFTSSREALETASRENAAAERSINDLQDLVKKIMLQDKVNESRELARHVGRALAARKGAGMNRGVKQAPFVVLIGADMPSVLAEICFISNPQDERLAKTPETRQAIAQSLLAGVRSYADSLSGATTAKNTGKIQE
jgi:N-acetylmuramoyl-L-alanine amidase